jgi:hypothetical protein
VFIEPVVELILKLTKSCEPVCVFKDCVVKWIEDVVKPILINSLLNEDVVVFIEPVVLAILKLTANWD